MVMNATGKSQPDIKKKIARRIITQQNKMSREVLGCLSMEFYIPAGLGKHPGLNSVSALL